MSGETGHLIAQDSLHLYVPLLEEMRNCLFVLSGIRALGMLFSPGEVGGCSLGVFRGRGKILGYER